MSTLSYIIDNKIITLNSKDAVLLNSSKVSNVNFKFKNILKKEKDIFYTTVSLYSCEIPVSFFNVNVNNYYLSYSVNGVSYSMTLAEGNYNSTTFISAFQTAFSTAGHGKTITVSINRLNGFLTFTVSSYTLIFLYSNSTMYEVLGLASSTNYTITTTLTAVSMMNLIGVKKIKILSYALSNNGIDSNTLGENSLLQTVSVNQPAYNLITWSNQSPNYSKLKQREINEIDIQLRDENDALIDFNGINWSLTIVLNIYRKFVEMDDFLNITPLEFKEVQPLPPKILKETIREVPNPNLEELKLLLS